MTKRQFVVLVFRLFALYLLFNIITSLGTLFQTASKVPGIAGFWVSAFMICVMVFAISLLWRKSEWLMQKVFAIPVLSDALRDNGQGVTQTLSSESAEVATQRLDEEAPEMIDYYETPISMESIQTLAFSVVGLWAALTALTTLLREINISLTAPIYSSEFSLEFILPSAIQLCLGVWLFLRPWQFQGWIEKFKPKGETDEEVSS